MSQLPDLYGCQVLLNTKTFCSSIRLQFYEIVMDFVSPFLSFICDGLKWAAKHISYALHVERETRKLEEEMEKLEEVGRDVQNKVDIARARLQHVKSQVEGWQTRVEGFKAQVTNDLQMNLNCSCPSQCPNCFTRYKVGKRVAAEHLIQVSELIKEGKGYSNSNVVDPNLPSPIEKNIKYLKDEIKVLRDVETDVISKVEYNKRVRLLLPKNEVEGWLQRVSAHKCEVDAIQEEFQQMENSSCHQNFQWIQLSERLEAILIETRALKNAGQSFMDVADPSRPIPLVQQYTVTSIGQNEAHARVLRLIKRDNIRTIGIYGMGGVGKTTLLKRINNSLQGKDFELVIWVVVSKDVNIGTIHQSIMKRCGLDGASYNPYDMESTIRNFLQGKKFVLLLDDVWEKLDLEKLGVPTPNHNNKYKILFTTRFEGVCSGMQAIKVRIDCLNPGQAWALFKAKVGAPILDSKPEINRLGQQIANQCGGLPLAIDVIGRAMSSKVTVSEWRNALTTLVKNTATFADTEAQLYSHLKLSYDSLANDTVRECFCYCALFSGDWRINVFDLVSCWIGEGFFDHKCDNIDEARDEGYTIVRDLILASLLVRVENENEEFGIQVTDLYEVQMHDVIREMALWIKKGKFVLSKGRIRGTRASHCQEAQRLSLLGGEGGGGLIGAPEFPNLSTLLMTRECVKDLGDDFFHSMQSQRVIYVYGGVHMRVDRLPPTIGELKELRCLNLGYGITLKSLPEEVGQLKKLRQLIITVPFLGAGHSSFTFEVVISKLSQLQVLILMSENAPTFLAWPYGVEDVGLSISDLERLTCLEDLRLFTKTTSFFRQLVTSPNLAKCISSLKLSFMDIRSFHLVEEVGSMNRLTYLEINSSDHMEEIIIDAERRRGYDSTSLNKLNRLHLVGLRKLKEFRVMSMMTPQNFLQNLTLLYMKHCNNLRIAYLGWPLPQLQCFVLDSCNVVEEVLSNSEKKIYVFPALHQVHLRACPGLRRICSDAFTFPRLEILLVRECPLLKKMPQGIIQARNQSLREIRGMRQWWHALEWDSQEAQMSLNPLFRPISSCCIL